MSDSKQPLRCQLRLCACSFHCVPARGRGNLLLWESDERMLNGASVALSPGGTLTIVSDNAWYAELLFEMVNEHGDFEGAASKKDAEAEGLGGPVTIVRAAPMSKSNQVRGGKSVTLLSAKPGAWCRHASSSASSYFDRMWQTGLSKHSAKEARYVLHLRRR